MYSQQQAVQALSNAQQQQTQDQAANAVKQVQAQQAITDAQTKQAQDAAASDASINKAEAALAAARKARAKDEITLADSVAAAEQKVADALRAQANQKRQSAFSVSSAQAGVSSAKRAVTGAGASSGGGGASELANINAQLAKVNPATLAFAKFVQGVLEPALGKLKGAAAGGLLPGVEKGFEAFLPILPSLTKFVGSLAKTMGDLFVQAGKALGSPFWLSFFSYVSGSAGSILTTFVKIIGNLATGFAGLMTAFAPITKAIGDGLLDLSKKFANFGTGKSGTLQAFLAYVKKEGPAVADMFGKLATLAGHIIVALAPLGDVMVKVIAGVSAFLNALNPTELLAIIGVVAALAAVFLSGPLAVIAIGVAMAALAGIIVRNWGSIMGAFTDAWNWIKSTWSTLWGGVKDYIVAPVSDAYNAVTGFFGKNGKMQDAFNGIWNWIKSTWSTLWSGAKKIYIQPYVDAYNWLTQFFGKGGDFQNAMNGIWGWISGAFSTLWGGVKKIFTAPFTAAKDAIEAVWNGKGGLISFLEGLPGKIAAAAVGMWDGIKDAFRSAIDWIINAWDGLHFTIHIPKISLGPFGHIGGGDYTLSLPHIEPLAAGGMTTGPALKLLGDNPGGREVALPLGSSQTTDALAVALGKALDYRPTPVAAFDNGGYLPMGLSAVFNGTGAPEPVFTPSQLAQLSIGAGDTSVQVFVGDEAIDPRFVRIAHGVVTGRAFAAQQDQRARRPGTTADLLVKNGPR